MTKLHPLAITLSILVPACRGPEVSASHEAPAPNPPATAEDPCPTSAPEPSPTEEIIELIRAGSLRDARAAIDRLLVDRDLGRARELLAAGSPEDALIAIDRALEVDPEDTGTELLKAEASLALAEKAIAERGSGMLIEGVLQDARDFFRRVVSTVPSASIGLSRAAYLAGDQEEATRFARRARRALADGAIDPSALTDQDRRHLADVLYGAYARARGNDDLAEERAALFSEAVDAYGELLGRRPDDSAAWARLSDLLEWEGRPGDARKRLEEGLARDPRNGDLLQRLARVARAEGGFEQSVRTLRRHVAADPNGALGFWYLGVEQFEQALGAMEQDQNYDPAPFTAAEQSFATCRRLVAAAPAGEPAGGGDTASAPLEGSGNADVIASCKGYEVMCRDARGWCAFYSDRLEDAMAEFLSMNELIEDGARWQLQGRLLSGVMGIAFVGDRYNQLEDNLHAALAFETAFHLEPDNADWANNAGFFLRDAAYEMELEARQLCKAARGLLKTEESLGELRRLDGVELDGIEPGSEEERSAFRRAADARAARARDLMERSWTAYQVAAELMPDDIRTVNDAGLVQDYYLHTDLEPAKALLLRAARLGDEQVPPLKEKLDAGGLSEEDRAALEEEYLQKAEAWGDAYQNLGVFAWLHDKDDEAAVRYLERAVEIGPRPRTQLTNNLIPWIQGTYTPGEDEYFDLAHWGEPCRD
ncbi:MAG TPA: tetratricopeptide repeat protein [Planctomycetes bacterium]|nr:tetratricopeptide repeat protein [Planctomycetota bacterium]